jgi:hypothetical protein
MDYFGWVPTVTGNLSFTTLGNGSFPSRCSRLDTSKSFVIYQKRDLLDVLVPFADDIEVAKFFREKIANWILRISGQFSFVMVATPDEATQCCRGEIYIVAHATNNKALHRSQKLLRDSAGTDEDLAEFVSEVVKLCCYEAKFELQRQGRLKISSSEQGQDSTVVEYILVNQSFFFVKDISHGHQHHDPRHDAITQMTADTDASGLAWIRETQQALYRSIIRYKRFRNEKALFRASGILAYTQSFQKSYADDALAKETYHQSELEQSLAVTRSEIQHFDQKRLASIETFRNFFFALFGLAMSVTFLARLGTPPDIQVDGRIVKLAITLATNPLEAVGFTVLASVIWMVFTHQRDPADSEIMRWITRITQSLRLRYYIFSNVIITAMLGIMSYKLLTWSLN